MKNHQKYENKLIYIGEYAVYVSTKDSLNCWYGHGLPK